MHAVSSLHKNKNATQSVSSHLLPTIGHYSSKIAAFVNVCSE